MEVLQRTANRGSISTGPYQIDNSCMFNWNGTNNAGNGQSYMYDASWTGTPTSTTTGCFSTWFKNSLSNATNSLGVASFVNNYSDGSNRSYIMGDWGSGGNFVFGQKVSGSWNFRVVSNALFRDPAAHYHFFAVWDTSNSTESERIRLYVNGERITSLSDEIYPSQNQECYIVSKEDFSVGRAYSSVYGNFTHGYMAETHFVDGTAYAPTDFGEFDEDSGIWKPKQVSVSYGNKGFYLDYKDASNLGNDVSGNNRDLTLSDIDSSNQATDTPTNNFCTLFPPPDAVTGTEPSVKEGGTTMFGGVSSSQNAFGTMGVRSGKWYFESTITDDGGVATSNHNFGVIDPEQITYVMTSGRDIGASPAGWACASNSSPRNNNAAASGANATGALNENEIMGVAIDMDNGKIWWHRQGTWTSISSTAGDPANGTTPAFSNLLTATTEHLIPAGGFYVNDGNQIRVMNFGGYAQSVFTAVGTYADANGYGSFA